jgi:hypothetical protein
MLLDPNECGSMRIRIHNTVFQSNLKPDYSCRCMQNTAPRNESEPELVFRNHGSANTVVIQFHIKMWLMEQSTVGQDQRLKVPSLVMIRLYW